jgi:thymidylate synthase
MISLDKEYQLLLLSILNRGVEKTDRTGTGTKSIFGYQFRHNMKDGFPILTTKKIHFKSVVTELLWFLRGETNIKYLVDNGCNIWNGDAFKNYYNKSHEFKGDWPDTQKEFIERIKTDDEFAEKWGDLGPIYGAQWRSWYSKTFVKTSLKDPLTGEDTYVEGSKWIDQIENLIDEILINPDSRRLMVNAWNVGELNEMVLPPCHYGFQVYTRVLSLAERRDWVIKNRSLQMPKFFDRLGWEGKILDVVEKFNAPTRAISLLWNQRSVDTFLGLPFNIASYGLLLELIAKEVNMVPDELIGNLGDCHLYLNHLEQAKDQVTREPFELPKLSINDEFWNPNCNIMGNIEYIMPDDFQLINYESHPAIKAPLSN